MFFYFTQVCVCTIHRVLEAEYCLKRDLFKAILRSLIGGALPVTRWKLSLRRIEEMVLRSPQNFGCEGVAHRSDGTIFSFKTCALEGRNALVRITLSCFFTSFAFFSQTS